MQEIKGVLLPVGIMSKSLNHVENPAQTRYPIFDKVVLVLHGSKVFFCGDKPSTSNHVQ